MVMASPLVRVGRLVNDRRLGGFGFQPPTRTTAQVGGPLNVRGYAAAVIARYQSA
jgi:hypothetical protein